jgi:FtsH-binding integral membrane protein
MIYPAAIAIPFLLGALYGHWPYGYYQLLRWIVTACALAFVWEGLSLARTKHDPLGQLVAWTFGLIAILFNPVAPIYFPRGLWLILDAAAAVVFALGAILILRHRAVER